MYEWMLCSRGPCIASFICGTQVQPVNHLIFSKTYSVASEMQCGRILTPSATRAHDLSVWRTYSASTSLDCGEHFTAVVFLSAWHNVRDTVTGPKTLGQHKKQSEQKVATVVIR